MAQVVYYGCGDNKLGYELEPLREYINKNILNTPDMKFTRLISCPAFKDIIHNTFIVKATYDYHLKWDGESFTSTMHDQRFFDNNIIVRSKENGFVSYVTPAPVFFAESDDLVMSQISAYFHDNDITSNTFTIPGMFNIGKHLPRKIELAIKFKRPCEIKINEGDALYYVKFHTEEDIKFKKFIMPYDLDRITYDNLMIRNFTTSVKSLQWWYNFMSRHNLKKYYLKRIKQNLL